MSNREPRPRTDGDREDWGRGNWALQSFCLERGTFQASIRPPKGHRDMIYWSSKEHHTGCSSQPSHFSHTLSCEITHLFLDDQPPKGSGEKHKGKSRPWGLGGLTPNGLLNLCLELGPSPFLPCRSFLSTPLTQHALVGGEWELMAHVSSNTGNHLGLSSAPACLTTFGKSRGNRSFVRHLE